MKIYATIIIIAMFVAFGFIIADYQDGKDVVTGRTYEGRVYLVEQEYEEFKQFLADNPEVEILNLDVLSSPNALIDMELYAPVEIELPYDIEITEHYRVTAVSTGTAVFVVLFIAVILFMPVFDKLQRGQL